MADTPTNDDLLAALIVPLDQGRASTLSVNAYIAETVDPNQPMYQIMADDAVMSLKFRPPSWTQGNNSGWHMVLTAISAQIMCTTRQPTASPASGLFLVQQGVSVVDWNAAVRPIELPSTMSTIVVGAQWYTSIKWSGNGGRVIVPFGWEVRCMVCCDPAAVLGPGTGSTGRLSAQGCLEANVLTKVHKQF